MLLLAGCSFVNSPDCHLTLFGSTASSYNDCRIVARGGAGNRYIAHSIIESITKLDVKKIFVLWSGMSRIDIPLPKSLDKDFIGYSHRNLEEDCLWVHTGGWGGLWTTEKNYPDWAKNYLKGMYHSQDWDFMCNQNLIQILSCLNTIETLGISYRWGFIYDIHQPYFDQASLGPAVDKNNSLINLLPKHTQITTTPYEFCRDAGFLDPKDDFHPTQQGWQEWKKQVSEQLDF
jgi:hypothetical protein